MCKLAMNVADVSDTSDDLTTSTALLHSESNESGSGVCNENGNSDGGFMVDDLLCFILNKRSQLSDSQLKDVVVNHFSSEVISRSNQMLIECISKFQPPPSISIEDDGLTIQETNIDQIFRLLQWCDASGQHLPVFAAANINCFPELSGLVDGCQTPSPLPNALHFSSLELLQYIAHELSSLKIIVTRLQPQQIIAQQQKYVVDDDGNIKHVRKDSAIQTEPVSSFSSMSLCCQNHHNSQPQHCDEISPVSASSSSNGSSVAAANFVGSPPLSLLSCNSPPLQQTTNNCSSGITTASFSDRSSGGSKRRKSENQRMISIEDTVKKIKATKSATKSSANKQARSSSALAMQLVEPPSIPLQQSCSSAVPGDTGGLQPAASNDSIFQHAAASIPSMMYTNAVATALRNAAQWQQHQNFDFLQQYKSLIGGCWQPHPATIASSTSPQNEMSNLMLANAATAAAMGNNNVNLNILNAVNSMDGNGHHNAASATTTDSDASICSSNDISIDIVGDDATSPSDLNCLNGSELITSPVSAVVKNNNTKKKYSSDSGSAFNKSSKKPNSALSCINAAINDLNNSNEIPKPYVCHQLNCQKSFANKFLLKKHEFIHTGLRPHQCPFCGKLFNRKDNLLRHKKTHFKNMAKQNARRRHSVFGVPVPDEIAALPSASADQMMTTTPAVVNSISSLSPTLSVNASSLTLSTSSPTAAAAVKIEQHQSPPLQQHHAAATMQAYFQALVGGVPMPSMLTNGNVSNTVDVVGKQVALTPYLP